MTYLGVVALSVVVALLAPAMAFLVPDAFKDEPVRIVAILGVAVSSVLAAWKLLQGQLLAGLRMTEWRTIARKLRTELYRIEGKRRAEVEAKQRTASKERDDAQNKLSIPVADKSAKWQVLSDVLKARVTAVGADDAARWDALHKMLEVEADGRIANARKLTPDEEARLRDEWQAAITAAEAAIDEELNAQFTTTYDMRRLSELAASVPTSLLPVQQTIDGVRTAKVNEASKRGEEAAADRKLERLEQIRAARVKDYNVALKTEMGLTDDGKLWESGEAKPKKSDELGVLIAQNKLCKRLSQEIDAIDAEWNTLRKTQRDRPA